MGYEDDILDAHDLDSIDDDYYSGGTPMDSEDSVADSDFVDNESDDSEDITSHRQQALETRLSDAGLSSDQAPSRSLNSKSLLGGMLKETGTISRTSTHNLVDANLWSCEHCTYAKPRCQSICWMCKHHLWFSGRNK